MSGARNYLFRWVRSSQGWGWKARGGTYHYTLNTGSELSTWLWRIVVSLPSCSCIVFSLIRHEEHALSAAFTEETDTIARIQFSSSRNVLIEISQRYSPAVVRHMWEKIMVWIHGINNHKPLLSSQNIQVVKLKKACKESEITLNVGWTQQINWNKWLT